MPTILPVARWTNTLQHLIKWRRRQDETACEITMGFYVVIRLVLGRLQTTDYINR